MIKTIHFIVSGRVQGVFFRMKTRQQAELHGISGWVRNLPDGRVEGVASASENSLDDFKQWLRQGPEMAKVSKVEYKELAAQGLTGFTIR
ncbi:MAG: acylphosphatase [Proteobacteria bacterium]|nr:acylphosphatase [Pseudomonadota bacterium]